MATRRSTDRTATCNQKQGEIHNLVHRTNGEEKTWGKGKRPYQCKFSSYIQDWKAWSLVIQTEHQMNQLQGYFEEKWQLPNYRKRQIVCIPYQSSLSNRNIKKKKVSCLNIPNSHCILFFFVIQDKNKTEWFTWSKLLFQVDSDKNNTRNVDNKVNCSSMQP